MMHKKLIAAALVAAVGVTGAIVGTTVIAADEAKPAAAGAPEMKLPPGWTMEDVQACMVAGTPGKNQEVLTKGAGTWTGKNTMWMMPGADPITTDTTSTVTPIMDGRYVKVEMAGEMPGMGPYSGFGIYGYDNVAGRFVSTWLDNHSTGLMTGTGELSPDGKVLTWTFNYMCPVTKKPTVMRDVETITGENTRTMEMYGKEPKSGVEYKMMKIELTRK